jgi:multidrug resistance efflux pump
VPSPSYTPSGSNNQSFFRKEALEAHLQEQEGRDILRVSPMWSWAVIGTVASLIVAAVGFAFLGQVEITEKGPGILRPQGGVRLLTAPGPGMVVAVLAHTGDHVRAGDPILRLDSPQLQGAVLEADRALNAHSQEFSLVANSQAVLFDQQIRTAQDRIKQLTCEVTSLQRTSEGSSKRLAANRELHHHGIIGKLEVQGFEDQFESAQRSVAASEQSLNDAKQLLTALDTQRRQEIWKHATEVALARAKREALDFSLSQTHIHAPVDGIVDGVVLRPGDQVQTGGLTAKVIPIGTPLGVIAFLREKDRAFVKEGDGVTLELAQYPHSEFGTLHGRVERVGTDLASANEILEAFSATEPRVIGPSFKVEIQLEPTRSTKLALRPGMILDARFTLRRQRLITIVLDPLRRWLK